MAKQKVEVLKANIVLQFKGGKGGEGFAFAVTPDGEKLREKINFNEKDGLTNALRKMGVTEMRIPEERNL